MLIVKYFFVGGVSVLVDITLLTIFAKLLNYNYIVVGTLILIIATRINYFLSINFVFKREIKYKKKIKKSSWFLVSFIGITINMCFIYFYRAHFDMVLSKLIANSCVFLELLNET